MQIHATFHRLTTLEARLQSPLIQSQQSSAITLHAGEFQIDRILAAFDWLRKSLRTVIFCTYVRLKLCMSDFECSRKQHEEQRLFYTYVILKSEVGDHKNGRALIW